MANVRAKLVDNYDNEFYTAQNGITFYKKGNSFGKPAEFQEVSLENHEIKMLIEQGILEVDKESINEKINMEKAEKVSEFKEEKTEVEGIKGELIEDDIPESEPENPIEEDKMEKAEIISDKIPNNTVKEIKTESNDEKMEEFVNN